MPTIRDNPKFYASVKAGIGYLHHQCGYNQKQALGFIGKSIQRADSTLAKWTYDLKPNAQIEDELLYGFAWIIITTGEAPLSWLVDLLSTTTAIIVQPVTPDWVRACFKWAKHLDTVTNKMRYPLEDEIEAIIQRCFPTQAATAMPESDTQPWEQPILLTLRQIAPYPNSQLVPPMERYWEGQMRDDMPMHALDAAYPYLQDALAQTARHHKFAEQIDITLLLIHYMHARWLMTERLTYVISAIEAAKALPNRYEGLWLEAMLHIDGAGWILIEQENYDAALPQIAAGLAIATQIEPETNTGYYDLTVLGNVYLALIHLQTTGDLTKAQAQLEQVLLLPCRAMVQMHRLRVLEMLATAQAQYKSLDNAYFAGVNLFFSNAAPVAKTGFFITAAESFLTFGQHWKARIFLQQLPTARLESDFSLPWFVEMKTVLARIALAEHKPALACQELYELFQVLEAKQKTHIKSRLLQNARQLYEEVRAFCR